MGELVICALLSLWLIATIAIQLQNVARSVIVQKFVRLVQRVDLFSIVPTWTFFAPRPGMHDYFLMYRDRLIDDSLSHWRTVSAPNESLLRAIWNPRKRTGKFVSDSVIIYARTFKSNKIYVQENIRVLSTPYLCLLSLASTVPATPLTAARQFAILQVGRRALSPKYDVLMLSQFHRLNHESDVQ